MSTIFKFLASKLVIVNLLASPSLIKESVPPTNKVI